VTLRPAADDNCPSMSGSALDTSTPPGSVIVTGWPRPGSPENRAENPRSAAHRRGSLALATAPVSPSTSAYARSPTTPVTSTLTSLGVSPCIDLTGHRRISATRTGPFLPDQVTALRALRVAFRGSVAPAVGVRAVRLRPIIRRQRTSDHASPTVP